MLSNEQQQHRRRKRRTTRTMRPIMTRFSRPSLLPVNSKKDRFMFLLLAISLGALCCFVCVNFFMTFALLDYHHHGGRREMLNDKSTTLEKVNLRNPSDALVLPLGPEQSAVGTVNTHQQQKQQQQQQRRWFWIGIVRDAYEVQESTWDTLAEAACTWGLYIHVTVAENKQYAQDQLAKRIATIPAKTTFSQKNVRVESESEIGMSATDALPTNRVDRISLIRNAQRNRIRELWLDQGAGWDYHTDIVIVADLDLFRLPSVSTVMGQVKSLLANDDETLDAVCAAGVTVANREELWYYDTYATVLLPDTYVHPLKRRLIKEYYAGENRSLVRSDNQHGPFTQGDVMRYLQQQAKATGTVKVRSCFGGLAIYRAAVWFRDECQYGTPLNDHDHQARYLQKYASEHDGRPCEHVAFHVCLQDFSKSPPVQFAIDPSMITLWKKN